MTPKTPIFGLIDCNNFYVSCERLFNPALEGKPVVVLSNGDGCVVSRSNEAKALKVKMAEPIFQLKDLIKLHKVHCFSSNYTLYGDISNRVMSCIAELVPSFEVYSIDEAFLDLSGFSPYQLDAIARKIVKTVKRWTGIPVSLGIGPTKTLAKVANYYAKKNLAKNNYFILNEGNRKKCLAQMPIGEVWGIGRKWAAKLCALNLDTAYKLTLENAEHIRKISNKVLAATTTELQGKAIQGIETLIPAKKSIVSSRSFGKEVTELAELKQSVTYHISRGLEKLRKQNSVAKLMIVFIQTNRFKSNFQGYHYHSTIELPLSSQNNQDFLKAALPALDKLYFKGLKYKKAGIVLAEISQKEMGQFDLFAECKPKEDKLTKVMDNLNKQLGSGTLRYAIEGFSKKWQMSSSNRSPRYTTRWDELPRVKAN